MQCEVNGAWPSKVFLFFYEIKHLESLKVKRFSFVYPFTHLPSLCFRCTCGPRNRRPHRQPAWGAGVRRDVRLPHHLQSGVRRRWSRHEGGQRVRGEPCALHSCARCNLPVCSDNMEKTKATRLPSDTFELSYSLISVCVEAKVKLQPGHLSLWPPFTLCVCSEIASVTPSDFCLLKAWK